MDVCLLKVVSHPNMNEAGFLHYNWFFTYLLKRRLVNIILYHYQRYRVTVLKMVHVLFYSDQICTKKMSYHLICKIISDLCHAFYGMHVFTFLILLLKILIFPNFHLLHRWGRRSVILSHILVSPHDKKCQTFLWRYSNIS